MKHMQILISLVFLSNTVTKAQCIEPEVQTGKKFQRMVIHGTHDHMFWTGDTLNILLEEVDHILYDTILSHAPVYYNDPAIDTWIQCRLDTGATPHDILNEYTNPESIIHHLYGKTYAGGYIFHIDVSGGGLVANEVDAPDPMNWSEAMIYPSLLSSGGYFDWYLPNKHELNEIYRRLKKKDDPQNSHYTLFSSHYWSSTEQDVDSAWAQDFIGTESFLGYKTSEFRVRAIRAFDN